KTLVGSAALRLFNHQKLVVGRLLNLDEGLQAVFKSVFPITDFSGASMLEFVYYECEPPKVDVDECRQRDLTYAAPLKVT
ncbi:hypothetical protein ACC690_39300, partial [Rhizobium johnstonii]|uniref:hypothetical protein n=1 Tax=Rhizobium johnstonii TaxID=3019933 RepID=UPI003F9BB0C7